VDSVRRCAVLGSPIQHSLSPALHRAAYGYLGLDWTYDRVEVDERGLAAFVGGLDASWRGLSLTMPLKVAVLELGNVDQLASLAGAGNTLILEGGSRTVHNTDVAATPSHDSGCRRHCERGSDRRQSARRTAGDHRGAYAGSRRAAPAAGCPARRRAGHQTLVGASS
jgi:hypothetical protein